MTPPLRILVVVGSPWTGSILHTVVAAAVKGLEADCQMDVLDFEKEPLALFHPVETKRMPGYSSFQERVDAADVILLATPDYHGSVSGTTKNFLDHFWREFCGKLFVIIVASHEKGLTVIDQLRTVARQCYAWTLPYALSLAESDVKDGQIISENLKNRLEMMVRDTRVYGELLARQRRADLSGADPGFLAKHRVPNGQK